MFYFSCKSVSIMAKQTIKSLLFCEARISGDLLQMTAGLARDRVESWPVSPGVTVRG